MEKLHELLMTLDGKELLSIILSNTRDKEKITKIKIRPILCGGELVFQSTSYIGKQVFHENLSQQELAEKVCQWMQEDFRQIEIKTTSMEATGLMSKKGTFTLKKKMISGCNQTADLSHNRKKKYILEEGKTVPFLVDLGVMTQEGRIVHAKYDKYKQINRYLEFVEDILPQLPKGRECTIIDFGCGKSYLIFALYYYLYELKKYDIRVIGLDLKETVIEECNQLKERYGYQKLEFICGDIETFEGVDKVDMVVTLHACDTATDYALYKAMRWGAQVILSVPCCQHELNKQIQNEILSPIFSYGLIKERMAALVTDGVRAELLRSQGYETQILEFIDMEHTPKNILIRAVKKSNEKKHIVELDELLQFLNIKPTLSELIKESEE